MGRPEKSVAIMLYHNNRLFGMMIIIIIGSMQVRELRLPLYLKCRQGLNTPLKRLRGGGDQDEFHVISLR